MINLFNMKVPAKAVPAKTLSEHSSNEFKSLKAKTVVVPEEPVEVPKTAEEVVEVIVEVEDVVEAPKRAKKSKAPKIEEGVE